MKLAQLTLIVLSVFIGLSLIASSYVTYAEPVDASAIQNNYIRTINNHIIPLLLFQILLVILVLKTRISNKN